MPSFLSLDSPVTTLTLATNNPFDIGTYSLTFAVSLVNRPNVTPLIKTFSVTITCQALNVFFILSPVLIQIEIGVTI